MKLRNKKTGEIGKLSVYTDGHVSVDDVVSPWPENTIKNYNFLAELNEEWEDYEEPKGSALDLMILTLTNFIENEPDEDKVDLKDCKQMLEKLKAWKRLKDNGYKFNGMGVEYDGYKIYLKCDIMKKEHYTPTQDHKDLDLLFGGEE